MQIRYHNSLAKLKIRTEGSNLHFYNVTGCAGLINSGDAITVASAYLVTRRKPSPGPDHDPSLQQGPGAPNGVPATCKKAARFAEPRWTLRSAQ